MQTLQGVPSWALTVVASKPQMTQETRQRFIIMSIGTCASFFSDRLFYSTVTSDGSYSEMDDLWVLIAQLCRLIVPFDDNVVCLLKANTTSVLLYRGSSNGGWPATSVQTSIDVMCFLPLVQNAKMAGKTFRFINPVHGLSVIWSKWATTDKIPFWIYRKSFLQ